MIDTKALRCRVLDLAIRGKLTEQQISDGTAEELYQQIQAEKQALIKEGKIKKEKPLPEISADEIPFEIPSNWKWMRMNDITFKITDGTHHSPINKEFGDYMYVTAKNIKDNGIDLSNISYVTREVHEEIFSRCNPELNDILLIKDGATTGVVTVNNLEQPFSLLSSVALIKPVYDFIVSWYIAYVLRSSLFYRTIRSQMTGTGITRIILRQIEPFIVPLPPLAEQKRIVERVEEIFKLLDTIDAAQEKYTADAESLKAKLITAGIQGKLTEQLDSDGTADELYQQIQAEKQKLIKEGKIKKEKPLPAIKDEEIPFEIPGNWKWVRLGDITTKITSGSTPPGGKKGNSYVTQGFCFFREQNIYNDGIHHDGMVFINEELLNTRQNSTVIANDILLNITGGSIGRCAIIPSDFDRGSINQHILIIRLVDTNMRYYIHQIICSPYVQKLIKSKAVGDKDGFSGGRCKNTLIPLPPLAEQKRIADKLNELLETIN